jgi:N-acetylglucosaminyldiphosphoundecaprenol N-acetyl-beta-D-mannosaminyltransferase
MANPLSLSLTAQLSGHRPSFRVLGVRVDAVQIPDVIAVMERWIQEKEGSHFVAVTGMHGVMESQQSPRFQAILDEASLVVPDGMPLVWLGRAKGFAMRRRVYGPELMATFCRTTASCYRHFFYGGGPGVAKALASKLHQQYGIKVAGTYSPPFRPLTPEEERNIVSEIRATAPDVVWVGLSTPKQEKWMWNFRRRLNVPVLVGVGAAFDFCAGRVKQAPAWMRENGLEWLFRLMTEPRRLWRRYLILGSKFVWNVNLEILKLKKFN